MKGMERKGKERNGKGRRSLGVATHIHSTAKKAFNFFP
jgi:hypothetical protein